MTEGGRETQVWPDWGLDLLESYYSLEGGAAVRARLAARGFRVSDKNIVQDDKKVVSYKSNGPARLRIAGTVATPVRRCRNLNSTTPLKRCKSCGEMKPRAREFFHHNGISSTGRETYKPVCIKCRNQSREYVAPIPEQYRSLPPDAVLVPLYSKEGIGAYTVIDAADYERVSQYRWFSTGNGYAFAHLIYTSTRRITSTLHRFLMSPPEQMHVDHINGDRLDNRRSNLRLATQQQNNINRPSARPGLRGVAKVKRGFTARVASQGTHYHLGFFPTAEEAARAYDAKAKELHGEFAVLNYPED